MAEGSVGMSCAVCDARRARQVHGKRARRRRMVFPAVLLAIGALAGLAIHLVIVAGGGV